MQPHFNIIEPIAKPPDGSCDGMCYSYSSNAA